MIYLSSSLMFSFINLMTEADKSFLDLVSLITSLNLRLTMSYSLLLISSILSRTSSVFLVGIYIFGDFCRGYNFISLTYIFYFSLG